MFFINNQLSKSGDLKMDLNESTTLEQNRKAWLKWQAASPEDAASLSDDEIILAWETDWKIASGEIEP